MNRSVLCNCGIEAENNFLLESLAACHNSNSKLVMHFTINIAFTNYINEFNLMEELEAPILTNKTISEYTLPVFLNKSTFDDTLLSMPLTLKEYINQYKQDSEIFDLKERHGIDGLDIQFSNKNFFTNNFIVDIFVFIIEIKPVTTTIIIIYALCKHNKLGVLVTHLALQQVKEVKAEEIRNGKYKHECTSQFYIIIALSIVIIGLVVFAILQVRRIRLCRGQLFLNVVKIMLSISDIQYYGLVRVCKTAGSIHLFKITGRLMADQVKLNKHYMWDILEIDWSEVKVTLNGKAISLPKSITEYGRNLKLGKCWEASQYFFHLALKQGFNWFMLTQDRQEKDIV